MMFAEHLDEQDRAWLDTYEMPGAMLVEGFIGVVCWIADDGSRRWRPVVSVKAPSDSIVGILELAKFQILRMLEDGGEGDALVSD
jgi:hypothetical protein